ncbi:MAG: MarR family winged helix-turn-helix transcriptional regulator [Acidimicrobiia bacterium]
MSSRRRASLIDEPESDGPDGMSIFWLLSRLDRLAHNAIEPVVRDLGLSVAQYTVLCVLGVSHGLSNAQLARQSFVSPQSMNEVLSRLQQLGLIQRTADPMHGRVLHTDLTARGRRVLRTCTNRTQRIEDRMLDGLDARQRAEFRRMIGVCVASLQRV